MSLYTWLSNGGNYNSEYCTISSRYNYWRVENNDSVSLLDIDIYTLPCNEQQIKVYTMPLQEEQIDEIVEKVIQKLKEDENLPSEEEEI